MNTNLSYVVIETKARELCALAGQQPDVLATSVQPYLTGVPGALVHCFAPNALRPLWTFYMDQAIHVLSGEPKP